MPKSAAAVTSEAGAALVPVVRVYDALDDLVTVIESLESTAELRRTIKLLLTGNRLRQNVRKAADLALPIGPVHDEALRHGLDAAEYLSQTVAYYDTLLGKLPRDARQFAVQAIKACKQELRLFLQAFPDDDVERARRTVYVLDVASFESM
ncbi:hypothetical protein CDCA_CDCA14G3872 [Cyanidium caldarium]|uniref:Uncharacterized protein n=1 Tax=Cyanidium caldarium TaxID=2771 RepID=A0AAV9IZW1_CYACA|nr:hypothetical protein CDCA_CDCA14G3872 [Cyanidium caldarium]